MKSRQWLLTAALAVSTATAAWGGAFGKVVSIGGHASDLALDEARGVAYIANFTANRVEVISLANGTVQSSIAVPSQPSSVAVSPRGTYLVVTHYANFAPPAAPNNAVTVVDLNSRGSRSFALNAAPFGVAFGADNMALIATASEFLLFDPSNGMTLVLDTIEGLNARTLPQPAPCLPPQITGASLATSRDGLWIYGLTDTLRIGYDVTNKQLQVMGYIASPPMGPRTVSVSDNGAVYTAGWALFSGNNSLTSMHRLMSQFPSPMGALHVGGHVIDSSRNLIYAEVPQTPEGDQSEQAEPCKATSGEEGDPADSDKAATTPKLPAPVLQILDGDNLAVLDQLKLHEHLAGKAVMSRDYNTVYALSQSGLTILPVGSVQQARRVGAEQEDLVFRGNFCDRSVTTQEINISDASGQNTDFALSPSHPGIKVSPERGTTPAVVKVTVDPSAFQNFKGTSSATIEIASSGAANLPKAIRVLVNTREPDQRGLFYNVPGKLVDILADAARDRYYILREDANQVLVFDGASKSHIATLKTGNTPTQMAMTVDGKHLLVGSENSQLLYAYDLDTVQMVTPVAMPHGHYPHSVAASANAILVANRVAGPIHTIDRVDLTSSMATELPTLGVFTNDIARNTVLTAAPNGSSILVAQSNGTLMLYNASADTFTVARKDGEGLAGAYAASNYDQFAVGNYLLNSSLVPVAEFPDGTGKSSGFAFVDRDGLRMTAADAAAPGVLSRVSTATGDVLRPTRTVEAPLLPQTGSAFTRTLAPLETQGAILALTTSGYSVLPADYDSAVTPPNIDRVGNAADGSSAVASGGLVSIFGSNLSSVTQSSGQVPLPTILGESCLTVNGMPVPMTLVSPNQINAQMPFGVEGSTSLLLRTPGGVSNTYSLMVSPQAPSVFRTQPQGVPVEVATVLRASNGLVVTPSNPIHRGDDISIYATGMGVTSPAVDTGAAAPSDPLAEVVAFPNVSLGGVPLVVTFAGLAPGQVGVYQINVHVGIATPLGWNVPLTIDQGGASTSLDVRVVR